MGTRGLVGFVVDGQEKLTYNHFDSYPDGLGASVLKFLHNAPADLREKAKALRLVNEQEPASVEDQIKLAQHANIDVGSGATSDWYVLLRDLQGDLAGTLEAGVMIDSAEFAADSLFCEWGYVVDLDENVFEVYEGFQQSPHSAGRFANLSNRDYKGVVAQYYPIKLVASWPLDELPTAEEFAARFSNEAEDD